MLIKLLIFQCVEFEKIAKLLSDKDSRFRALLGQKKALEFLSKQGESNKTEDDGSGSNTSSPVHLYPALNENGNSGKGSPETSEFEKISGCKATTNTSGDISDLEIIGDDTIDIE